MANYFCTSRTFSRGKDSSVTKAVAYRAGMSGPEDFDLKFAPFALATIRNASFETYLTTTGLRDK
jgi:hypothetical protein